MTDRELAIRQRLKDDFLHYAEKCLNIRTKSGEIKPFQLNQAQLYIHEQIEKQRRSTGKVRAIILKGRQQGCSTYTEGRYYWRVTHSKGVRAFILTHEQAATDNLFDMVSRYHENCPDIVKPNTGAANAKELNFDRLDSGYKVGTAGTKAVGRSSTVQFFHGSEVCFWPNAKDHAAGIMQAIPDEPGTEVILESTANGMGNYYHEQWQLAEAGLSEFVPIFVPWFWQGEYRSSAEDIVLSEEELEYQSLYGLDDEQMSWRRKKIVELGEALFRQEYPATPVEAFQASAIDGLIHTDIVAKARKEKVDKPWGPLLVGVDPNGGGKDRCAIIRRKGRKAFKLETIKELGPYRTMHIVGRVVEIINGERPAKVFIDVVGIGMGIVDRLRELGFGNQIMAVNAGESPSKPKYYNKRSEMWGEMLEWLKDQPAEVPDSDELHADLTGPQDFYDSKSRMVLEKKEDMAKRGLRSPDLGDALALTFAYPVKVEDRPETMTEAERDFHAIHGLTSGKNMDDF